MFPLNPLLYERPQLAGTCTASSKMFYLRSFGLQGRLLEMDFKIELIKQLLNRIVEVQKSGLSRPFLLDSVKRERDARSAKDNETVNAIREEREKVFREAKMQEDDQFIFMYPQMFISLISSALNEMLEGLYWIIKNKQYDIARTLFEHFLQETKPLFEKGNPYATQLLDNVSPLIDALHKKEHLSGVIVPFEIHLPFTDRPRERAGMVKEEIAKKMEEIRSSCIPYSKDKLPICFYHIIDAIFLFPHEPELAKITSEVSSEINFEDVSPALSYLILDAMRTVYGEDFIRNEKSMQQVAFVKKLNWNYHPTEKPSIEECAEYSYEACLKGMLIFLLVAFTLERVASSTLHFLYLKTSKRLRIGVLQRILEVDYTAYCFYHIIKTLREYPDAPELSAVTDKVAKEVNFKTTPSELAFLIHDAMRSVYGKDFIKNPEQCSRIAFAMDMPKDYKGNETLATDCEDVTDDVHHRQMETSGSL